MNTADMNQATAAAIAAIDALAHQRGSVTMNPADAGLDRNSDMFCCALLLALHECEVVQRYTGAVPVFDKAASEALAVVYSPSEMRAEYEASRWSGSGETRAESMVRHMERLLEVYAKLHSPVSWATLAVLARVKAIRPADEAVERCLEVLEAAQACGDLLPNTGGARRLCGDCSAVRDEDHLYARPEGCGTRVS